MGETTEKIAQRQQQNDRIQRLSREEMHQMIQGIHTVLTELEAALKLVPVDKQGNFPQIIDAYMKAVQAADDALAQEAEPSWNIKVTIHTLTGNVLALGNQLSGNK